MSGWWLVAVPFVVCFVVMIVVLERARRKGPTGLETPTGMQFIDRDKP